MEFQVFVRVWWLYVLFSGHCGPATGWSLTSSDIRQWAAKLLPPGKKVTGIKRQGNYYAHSVALWNHMAPLGPIIVFSRKE